jgi:exocyst complex component 4
LDYDSQAAPKTEEEEMYQLLESSVPGLVLQRERTKEVAGLAGRGVLDGAITGHKLLVSPDPFNMVYLLPPTISFLDRVKELIPYALSTLLPLSFVFLFCRGDTYGRPSLVSSTVTSFLDDFLVAVFLPQLEDTVTDAFSRIVDEDMFQTTNRPD